MIRKICFFSTSFAIHKQVRLGYAEKFLPEDVEIFMLTPKSQNKYQAKRTKIIELNNNKISFTLALRNFCSKNKVDLIVNLGSPNESFAMMLSTLFSRTNYIIHFCSNIFDVPYGVNSKLEKFKSFIGRFFLSFPIYFARKVIFTSEDLEEMGKIKFRNSKSKINFVPLIIDEKLFVPQDKIKMKKELGLPLDKPIILYVGRISYLKGSDILFELAQQNKDKIFLVIGEIFDEIIGKNPSDNLILAKQQKMNLLIKYYSAADLFIFPSRIEAYGLSPREAMLCETPSLVSDITALGLTEYALKSKPEILDMQKQIDIFFSMSQKERNKLRKISRESVVKTNSFENLKDKWESILLD